MTQVPILLLVGTLALLSLDACSTIAEPAEDGPPVCSSCAPGQRELQCRTGEFDKETGNWNGLVTSAQYAVFCIEVDATDEQKEQACLAACDEWLVDDDHLTCNFLRGMDPFSWTGCVEPGADTDPGAGASSTCPGWYSPSTYVAGYEQFDLDTAAVHVERVWIDRIAGDLSTLYECDSTRYRESKDGSWTFVDVESPDLMHHLGIRSGDRMATVQGFEPRTGAPTTASHQLDGLDAFARAHATLHAASGVLLSVERPNAPSGRFEVWITLDG